MRRAQEVDPLSLIASAALGWVQFHRGNFDAAAQQCQRTIELNANFEQAWLWGGLGARRRGPLRRGVADAEARHGAVAPKRRSR